MAVLLHTVFPVARTTSWFAPLSVLLFFLAGAAGAILWDLRGHATPAGSVVSGGLAPARKVAERAPRPRERGALLARPPARFVAGRTHSARPPARARRVDSRFKRVGIPMESRGAAPAPPSAALSQAQAQRILKSLIESRGYYGLPSACLWVRPLGYRDASYDFEVVAADCESIARGSVIGRWSVDASSGEASYRTPEGTYQPSP